MKRYIDPTKIKFIGDTFTDAENEVYIRLSDVKKAIAQTPAEDVEKVRHGYWRQNQHARGSYYCSACGRYIQDGTKNRKKFSPIAIAGPKWTGDRKKRTSSREI